MKDFKEPKAIHIQPKHINIPTNVCDVSKFTFINPDNGRKYGYDSNGTPCISKPIQNTINVSYIPPKESSSITYVSSYSSFTPQDRSFVPKHNIFSSQEHNINISNRQEVSQSYEEQKAQKTKEEIINETWERHKAIEAEKLEVINTALKLKAIQEFEASDLGKATKLVQQAEEVYDRKVKHLGNIKKNIFYEKNKALAIQQIEQAAKQVEVFKAIKVKAELEDLNDRSIVEERTRHLDQISQENQAFLTERFSRINHTKEKLHEVELNRQEHNSSKVETHYPKIIATLKQYKSDYHGFNNQIISESIPIQALNTLSLKKTDSIDSHAVNLVFDLLRDNHLPSLKTLDLSDNPKSIGADQIDKLADSFFSGNNNLETLDISCVYPPTTDLRNNTYQQRGEHLGGDQNKSGNDNLRYAFSKLLVSVSTCNQPLCITIDAVISNSQEGYIPEYGLHQAPFSFIPREAVWFGEPAFFKTTNSDMFNHIRQVLPMTRDIRDKQLLISKHLFPHNVKTLPNVVENFTWGITKCLAQTKLTKKDFEWVQKNYHHYQEFNYLLPKIVELTQNPLEVFVCITEVMEDSIISHNMLNHKAKWEDVFSSEYIKHNIGIREISGLDGLTKQPIVKGKTNTQSFDSGCKQCEESQFAHFLNVLSILEKNDVTAMTNLNLSNSDMDDCDASILAKLIRQGKLPNLKAIDMSGNQITNTGKSYLANSLNSITQDLKIVLESVKGFSKDALKTTMKAMLSIAKSNGISTKETLTTGETIEHCKKGTVNVGLNIVGGYYKCTNPMVKIAHINEMNLGTITAEILGYYVKPIGAILTFACITENTIFSVVDEDFANCLVGIDSLLEE